MSCNLKEISYPYLVLTKIGALAARAVRVAEALSVDDLWKRRGRGSKLASSAQMRAFPSRVVIALATVLHVPVPAVTRYTVQRSTGGAPLQARFRRIMCA